MNYNSTKNQEIKAKFVQRDVFAHVGQMVESILSCEENDLFSFEDIENFYKYPDYNGKHISLSNPNEDEKNEAVETLESKIEALNEQFDALIEAEEDNKEEVEKVETLISEVQEEKDELENLESEPQEIFEWWIVSSYLGEKLKELGEPILEDGMNMIWGRTTTGQAILLDWAISKVCEDLEILEGQSSDWSK